MSCHKKNNMIPNPCTDPCKTKEPCGCIPNQYDHCIIVSEDLSNLEAERGSKLKEALKSIDDYLGRLKEEISTAKTFIIRNVGDGAKVFKGISLFGRRDFRTIVAEDDTISITQEEDEIIIKSNYDTVEIKTSSGITGGGQLKDNLEFKIDPDYGSFNNYYNKTEVYNKTEIDEEVVGDGKITIKDGVSDLGFFNTNDHNNKSIDIKPAIGDGEVSFRREGQIVDSFTANQKTDKIIDLGDLRGYPGADMEVRYRKNTNFSTPPALAATSRIPSGWSLEVPDIVVGEYMWMTQTKVDYEDNIEQNWSKPLRYTGVDGTDGQTGTGYTVISTNPIQSIAVGSDGIASIEKEYDVTIKARLNTTELSATVNGANPTSVNQYSVGVPTVLPVGIEASRKNNNTITFKVTAGTEFTESSETMVIPVKVSTGLIEMDTSFVLSPIFTADDAESLDLKSSTVVVSYDGEGVLKGPSQVTFTAVQQNYDEAITWTTVPAGISLTAGANSKEKKATAAVLFSEGREEVTVKISTPNGLWDEVRVVKISDGAIGQPGLPGAPGDAGVTGYSSITLNLYRRGASKPSRPTAGAKYNFTTNILASTPSGWSREVPNDNGQPCWISTTTIITKEEEVTIATNSWTDPVKFVESGKKGDPGNTGDPGDPGYSSAVVFLYTTTNESTTPTQPSSLNYNFSTGNLTGNKGVWTETVPINSDPIIWFTVGNAVSSSNTVNITNWSAPAILSKPGTPGKRGPSVVFRGTWNNKATYHGSEDRVDFVIMPGTANGYITTIDAGNISGDENKPTTASSKWNGPIANSDAIFTDFLIAYSAHIDDLTVGVIQTGPTPIPTDEVPGGANTDFERTTIGYNPPAKVGTLDYEDPTSGWSRHGIRQYWPNGRIMSYQGYVESFIHNDLTILNEWALIVWLDDGEPSYFQSKSGDVKKYITQGTTVPSMNRFGTLRRLSTKPSTATVSDLLQDINVGQNFNSSANQTNAGLLTSSDSAYYTKNFFGDGEQMFNPSINRGVVNSYDKGDIAANQTKYEALYMVQSVSGALDQSDTKSTPPLIPDGWYDRGVGGTTLLAIPKQGEEDFILRLTYYKDGLPVGSPKNVVVHTRTI